ncbi:hypothetical protein E4T56_gene10823 [Termitomyces sp. T112]|nr:hypothetical protein E4T56_gene10823 [Termitomyces sp. T112]
MATTSVILDFNSSTTQPPPLDPQAYFPHPTPGVDFAQLAGNFDPTAIPSMDPNHVPGTGLTHNQTMLQNSLVDAMTEVAYCPVYPPPDQSSCVSTVKLCIKQIIQLHTASFPNDNSCILYVGFNLKDGMPIKWKKFADPSLIQNTNIKLDALKQIGSAHYYISSFMELASHLDMMEQTKITCFIKGLKSSVKDHLVNIVDCPSTLEAWEPLIISIDTNLYQCEVEHHLENSKKKFQNNYSSTSHFPSHSTTPSVSIPRESPSILHSWMLSIPCAEIADLPMPFMAFGAMG